MSRLDDELRKAFRREQPSIDFADKLLERIAREPAPKRSWRWLAEIFRPPKLRWVAIGATATLLVALGAAQYSRFKTTAVEDTGEVANIDRPGPEPVAPTATNSPASKPMFAEKTVASDGVRESQQINRHRKLVASRYRRQRVVREPEAAANPEAQAAKEKVMLALHIASSALNDAQKALREDGGDLKP